MSGVGKEALVLVISMSNSISCGLRISCGGKYFCPSHKCTPCKFPRNQCLTRILHQLSLARKNYKTQLE